MMTLLALCAGFLLDLLLGDPHWLPHPVRLIGWLIAKAERLLRGKGERTPSALRRLGAAEVVIVAALSTAVPLGILWLAGLASPWLRLAAETVMCYQILAAKSLCTESMKVYRELQRGDLPAARHAVSMIVGRDTQSLDRAGITKAAVETVAENTSDGVVAPLLFLALGGAPLGFFYKAVNTMDSMLGYKNHRYLDFGRAAAKLDDLVNYLPARISGWVMVAAAYLLSGFDGANAKRIYRRDRRCHASPNSAQTESACAGALRLQLAGDAYYFGKLVHKPTIGDPLREIGIDDIPAANRLMYATATLSLAGCALLRLAALLLYRAAA